VYVIAIHNSKELIVDKKDVLIIVTQEELVYQQAFVSVKMHMLGPHANINHVLVIVYNEGSVIMEYVYALKDSLVPNVKLLLE